MSAISVHRRARTFVAAAVVLLAGWFLAPAALAHDVLIESSPADGEVLTESPAAVTLTFNNPPLEVGSAIVVEDVDGDPVVESEGLVEGTEVRLELAEPLHNGDYTVAWRVASSDGHPIDGRIPFTVEAPEPAPVATTDEPVDDVTQEATADSATEPEPTTDTAEAETVPAEDDSGSGLPTWAFVVIAIAALGALGGVIVTMVRRQREAKDDPSV